MRPIHYYVEETDQMNAFINLVGECFEKLNHGQLWDLSIVLSHCLGRSNLNCKSFSSLNTYFHLLELGPDETIEQALTVLDKISRKTAKQLVLAIAAIAAESEQY